MPTTRIFLGCSVFSFSRYKNSSSYKDEYRQGIKCSFCTVVKESSLNEGSIEQTNFLKLSASIAGTDGQHITETLNTVITFQNKHLNVYIWMKETKLYVARISNFCTQSFIDVTGFATNPVLQTEWSPVRHRKYLAWTQRSDVPCRENQWET